jgi:hypothetical protein
LLRLARLWATDAADVAFVSAGRRPSVRLGGEVEEGEQSVGKQIAEAAFTYGFPMIMNYGVMYASFCVQGTTPPYRYVSVEGPTSIESSNFETNERPMAIQYLGTELGEQYLAATGAARRESQQRFGTTEVQRNGQQGWAPQLSQPSRWLAGPGDCRCLPFRLSAFQPRVPSL